MFGAAVFVAVAMMGGTAFAEAGDPAKGEKVYKKCRACHMVGDNAKNRVGPALNGVIGRKAGTGEKYKYSKLMVAAGEAGLEWTEEELAKYVADPTNYLKAYLKEKGKEDQAKGRGKMSYKLRKDQADIAAYLKTFSK